MALQQLRTQLRKMVADHVRDLRSVPIKYLTIRESNRAIRAYKQSYWAHLWRMISIN